MNSKQNNYNFVAYFYDILASIYSGGKIYACKRFQAQHIKSRQRILYAGAGSADDAILAAQKGALVTVVELSENMLIKAEKKIRQAGLQAQIELIQGDVFQHSLPVNEQGQAEYYDIVAANFFLNVFDGRMMPIIFNHLSSLLRPGGYFYIADFSPPSKNAVIQLMQYLYFGLAMTAFVLTAKNALHPLYNYKALLSHFDYQVEYDKAIKLFKVFPFFHVIIAKKPACI